MNNKERKNLSSLLVATGSAFATLANFYVAEQAEVVEAEVINKQTDEELSYLEDGQVETFKEQTKEQDLIEDGVLVDKKVSQKISVEESPAIFSLNATANRRLAQSNLCGSINLFGLINREEPNWSFFSKWCGNVQYLNFVNTAFSDVLSYGFYVMGGAYSTDIFRTAKQKPETTKTKLPADGVGLADSDEISKLFKDNYSEIQKCAQNIKVERDKIKATSDKKIKDASIESINEMKVNLIDSMTSGGSVKISEDIYNLILSKEDTETDKPGSIDVLLDIANVNLRANSEYNKILAATSGDRVYHGVIDGLKKIITSDKPGSALIAKFLEEIDSGSSVLQDLLSRLEPTNCSLTTSDLITLKILSKIFEDTVVSINYNEYAEDASVGGIAADKTGVKSSSKSISSLQQAIQQLVQKVESSGKSIDFVAASISEISNATTVNYKYSSYGSSNLINAEEACRTGAIAKAGRDEAIVAANCGSILSSIFPYITQLADDAKGLANRIKTYLLINNGRDMITDSVDLEKSFDTLTSIAKTSDLVIFGQKKAASQEARKAISKMSDESLKQASTILEAKEFIGLGKKSFKPDNDVAYHAGAGLLFGTNFVLSGIDCMAILKTGFNFNGAFEKIGEKSDFKFGDITPWIQGSVLCGVTDNIYLGFSVVSRDGPDNIISLGLDVLNIFDPEERVISEVESIVKTDKKVIDTEVVDK